MLDFFRLMNLLSLIITNNKAKLISFTAICEVKFRLTSLKGGKLIKKIVSKNIKNPDLLTNEIIVFLKNPKAGTLTFIKSLSKIDNSNLYFKLYSIENNPTLSAKTLNINILNRKRLSNLSFKTSNFFHLFIDLFKIINIFRVTKPSKILCLDIYTFVLLSAINYFKACKFKIVFRIGFNLFAYISNKKPELYKFFLLKLIGFFINKCDIIITTSHELLTNVEEKFVLNKQIKRFVIYNGIEIGKIITSSKKKVVNTAKKKSIILISIGRFEEQKDFLTVVNSFKLLRLVGINVELHLIGDGKNLTEIKNVIYHEKIRKIKFYNWKKNIFPALSLGDIFIFSSKYEGFGYVILEAMAVGLAIVSSNTDYGPREILDYGKYGLLYEPGNYQELAKKISYLINNKKTELYKKKALVRSKYFDENSMLKKYIQVLKIN